MRALREVHRVLRPSGQLVFLEHVGADPAAAPTRLRWQQRIEPLWRHLAGDCHLTRRTDATIAECGFAIEELTPESMRKALPFLRPTVRGRARKRGSPQPSR